MGAYRFHLSLYIAPILLIALTHAKDVDIIIVGAGTAGCVLAGRLCEALPAAKIMLIERGVERDEETEFKVRSPRLSSDTDTDKDVSELWTSLPNPGLLGGTSTISTSRTLGGSSATNGMQWALPLNGTVERFKINGLTSPTALKYYRRAFKQASFSKQPGPLRPIYTAAFVKAGRKAGFSSKPFPLTYTSESSLAPQIVSVAQGRRVDSCTAYLTPAVSRCSDNLEVVQGVTVTRLLFGKEEKTKIAGIEYVRSSDKDMEDRQALLAEEVILSAGPFGSPKLLQISGVGPKEQLEKAGVTLKFDLPVGERTQARAVGIVSSVYRGVPIEPANNSTLLNSVESRDNFVKGQSSVYRKHPVMVIGKLSTGGYSFTASTGGESQLDVPVFNTVCLVNPGAYGYLHIRDSDPFSTPDVQLNILGDPKDLTQLRSCMSKYIQVHESLPSRFESTVVFPRTALSDEALRNSAFHGYHFVGGCAVGDVVDGDLRVKGIDGLYVVDASVMNSMPLSAGPLASTYMIAEYMSEKLTKVHKAQFGPKASRR